MITVAAHRGAVEPVSIPSVPLEPGTIAPGGNAPAIRFTPSLTGAVTALSVIASPVTFGVDAVACPFPLAAAAVLAAAVAAAVQSTVPARSPRSGIAEVIAATVVVVGSAEADAVAVTPIVTSDKAVPAETRPSIRLLRFISSPCCGGPADLNQELII